MKVAVVPFAVIQRHRNQSINALDYLGELHAREAAEKALRMARAKIVAAKNAMERAAEIHDLQEKEGIHVVQD